MNASVRENSTTPDVLRTTKLESRNVDKAEGKQNTACDHPDGQEVLTVTVTQNIYYEGLESPNATPSNELNRDDSRQNFEKVKITDNPYYEIEGGSKNTQRIDETPIDLGFKNVSER